jgi:hypothetical protein
MCGQPPSATQMFRYNNRKDESGEAANKLVKSNACRLAFQRMRWIGLAHNIRGEKLTPPGRYSLQTMRITMNSTMP